MTTRRGFFKSMFGATAAVVPTALGGYVIGVDVAKGEDRTAFNFTCACGEGFCAEVPKEVGEKINFDCTCGVRWELEWMGGSFKTKMRNRKGANASALEDRVNQSLEDRLEGLRGRPDLPSVMDDDYEHPPLD
jgi:hypothetical protein